MSATIRDVARLAGVNPSTVSRVINEKSVITAETRERVYSAMAQLDYHPNSLARSLVSGLAGAIGMVLDTGDDGAFNNAFFGSSQYAIEQVAQAHGYHLLIANGGERALETVTELVLGKKVDGLILPPSAATPQVLARISDFPHVILGQPDEDLRLNTWVDVDNRSGAALATAHLLEQGYRRVAYFGGMHTGGMGFIRRRLQGYQAALPAGCPSRMLPTDAAPDSAYRTALACLAEAEHPDAFVCDDNFAAFGLLRAARDRGLRVPQDIGIAAFNNAPLAEYLDPPLTAVDIDTAMQGRQTAQLLFEQIAQKTPLRQVLVAPRLIVRASSVRE